MACTVLEGEVRLRARQALLFQLAFIVTCEPSVPSPVPLNATSSPEVNTQRTIAEPRTTNRSWDHRLGPACTNSDAIELEAADDQLGQARCLSHESLTCLLPFPLRHLSLPNCGLRNSS